LESSTNCLGLWACPQIHRLGRSSFCRRTLGRRNLRRAGVLDRRNFSRVIRGRSGSIDCGAFGRAFRRFRGAGVLLRWRRRLGRRFSFGLLRVLGPESPLGLCCPPQHDSGKLGDGLHGGVPFLAM